MLRLDTNDDKLASLHGSGEDTHLRVSTSVGVTTNKDILGPVDKRVRWTLLKVLHPSLVEHGARVVGCHPHRLSQHIGSVVSVYLLYHVLLGPTLPPR